MDAVAISVIGILLFIAVVVGVIFCVGAGGFCLACCCPCLYCGIPCPCCGCYDRDSAVFKRIRTVNEGALLWDQIGGAKEEQRVSMKGVRAASQGGSILLNCDNVGNILIPGDMEVSPYRFEYPMRHEGCCSSYVLIHSSGKGLSRIMYGKDGCDPHSWSCRCLSFDQHGKVMLPLGADAMRLGNVTVGAPATHPNINRV